MNDKRQLLRLVRCRFCKKPGRWTLAIKVYPKGVLIAGMQPQLLTRMGVEGLPPMVCDHHMMNIPAQPIEFADPTMRAAWDEWGYKHCGTGFTGWNFESAQWHFERYDGYERVPGALV